ncbi:hypothetical protein [Kiloniella antarctica]|uniref:Chemotaxis methyl-accepting receptor HlyB-like 4HB MCP domain-containing protein n=1 Tax=Kiloniella antarctica TaxID=1550907 RepID=A0ABW5BHD8_9PROT
MNLLRRYNKTFVVAVAFSIFLEVFGYMVMQNELIYLDDKIKNVNEQYRNLSRLTKTLLWGDVGKPVQKDAWIKAWKSYDESLLELGTQRYQLLLTDDIKDHRDTIFLFWASSQKSFKQAVEKINQVFPEDTKIPTSTGIFPLLDDAKKQGDRSSIILLSELISSLISFNVFAKEVMQIDLLKLDKEINELIERINYYYWLQLSIVLFAFFISSIILLFYRNDPLKSRRKRLRKAKKSTKIKRKPPRNFNRQ